MLEKTLESPLDSKEIQPVHPKGNQSWIFIGRTYAEAETPILWPPDVKNWLIWKDPDAGNDWRQEEKGTTEDEMVGWHHQLNGHEFKQAPGDGDGQGSLACCSPWGCRESDTTERLNWTELIPYLHSQTFFLTCCLSPFPNDFPLPPSALFVLSSDGCSVNHLSAHSCPALQWLHSNSKSSPQARPAYFFNLTFHAS